MVNFSLYSQRATRWKKAISRHQLIQSGGEPPGSWGNLLAHRSSWAFLLGSEEQHLECVPWRSLHVVDAQS